MMSFLVLLGMTAMVAQAKTQFQYRTIQTSSGEQKIWAPHIGLRWHIQYTGDIYSSEWADYDVVNLDLFDTEQWFIDELRAAGKKVMCYMNAGTYEDWRDDADDYDWDVIGRRNIHWDGERWLDTRRLDILRPIIEKRMKLAKSKNCDAVDADNVDGHVNRTGFDLQWGDTLAFAQMIVELAHENGMAIGLKNNLTQISTLKHDIDFAVNEECFEFEECGWYEEFVAIGKPVYSVEYKLDPAEYCPVANNMGFDSLLKNLQLDEWAVVCRDYQ